MVLVALLLASLLQPLPAFDAPDVCRYDTTQALAVPLESVLAPSDPMTGSANADVVLVEFFDPNCTHCRRLHPILDEVVNAYGDRIRYYRKPFALSRHSMMQVAAIVAAGTQGAFYEMAARQMESPNAPYLAHDELLSIATDLGLDLDAFQAEMESADAMNRVQRLRQQARDAGVRGTPTLVINDSRQVLSASSRSVECISEMIEKELAKTG